MLSVTLIILFVTLTAQIGYYICTLCLRSLGFHATSAFICNILKGDLYFYVSITELFQICVIVSQTLREGTLVQMSLLVCEGDGGVSSALLQKRTALRTYLWDQWQRGTLYGTLSYLSYLWDLGKQEQKGVGGALNSSTGVEM